MEFADRSMEAVCYYAYWASTELAKERAKAVRDALLAAGVADTAIHLQPPANITGSGSDMEARRVEIAQVD